VSTDLGALVVDSRESEMMKKKSPRPVRRADPWALGGGNSSSADAMKPKPEGADSARERRVSDRNGGGNISSGGGGGGGGGAVA